MPQSLKFRPRDPVGYGDRWRPRDPSTWVWHPQHQDWHFGADRLSLEQQTHSLQISMWSRLAVNFNSFLRMNQSGSTGPSIRSGVGRLWPKSDQCSLRSLPN